MSHFLKDLLPPEAIISESSQGKSSRVEKKKNEELHRYSLFESPIKQRGLDGRTYDYIDENGEFVSHFISQNSPLISDNIEPEVKILVRTLHAYGYLTMGSCQGHTDSQFRWVLMVFTKPEQLAAFKILVDSFKLPISWYDNFLNFREKPKSHERDSFQLSFTWDQKPDSKRSLRNLASQGYTEAELTKYLNIMYSRYESKYYLTKMVIASKMGDKRYWDILKWKLLYRQRDEITDKLLNRILQTEMVTI